MISIRFLHLVLACVGRFVWLAATVPAGPLPDPTPAIEAMAAALDEIKIGMKVKLEFRRMYAEGHDGIIEYGHKAVPVRG